MTTWNNRGQATTTTARIQLISAQLALVTAAYCRQYVDYSDPNGEFRETEETPDTAFRDMGALRRGLEEIAVYAAAHEIPFSAETQTEMAKQLLSQNGDVWDNSSIGC